jgi:hypothetical protein
MAMCIPRHFPSPSPAGKAGCGAGLSPLISGKLRHLAQCDAHDALLLTCTKCTKDIFFGTKYLRCRVLGLLLAHAQFLPICARTQQENLRNLGGSGEQE